MRNLLSYIINKSSMVPPPELDFVGGSNFEGIGKLFLGYFTDLAGLKPDEKILDVGCGIGRMAIPLTGYLAKNAEYQGFDIVEKGIKWCQEKITVRYPQFHFQLADIYNKMYNSGGKTLSSEYVFPYKSDYFDFVFLTSVFTHMYSKDMENYLSEISRVTKKGGRILLTFFILNDESLQLIESGKSTQNFNIKIDEHTLSISPDVNESAIGFNEEYLKNIFKQNNLIMDEPVHYGSWCGRSKFKCYQDIIIARKI
jgi:SAM-dependent methyltransferase